MPAARATSAPSSPARARTSSPARPASARVQAWSTSPVPPERAACRTRTSRWAVRSGTGQSRWAIGWCTRAAAEHVERPLGVDRDAGPADVDVDPAPVVVPPVGGVGEDRTGGEVGALLPADRLQRARRGGDRWLGRTSTSTSLECRPAARRPGRTAGPLRWSRSMPAVVGELLHDGVGEVDAGGDGHPARRRVRLLGHAPIVPAASRRSVRVRPVGTAPRPRLAGMTFGDFVRLSRAYVWVLIGCTILGAAPDDRQDDP